MIGDRCGSYSMRRYPQNVTIHSFRPLEYDSVALLALRNAEPSLAFFHILYFSRTLFYSLHLTLDEKRVGRSHERRLLVTLRAGDASADKKKMRARGRGLSRENELETRHEVLSALLDTCQNR